MPCLFPGIIREFFSEGSGVPETRFGLAEKLQLTGVPEAESGLAKKIQITGSLKTRQAPPPPVRNPHLSGFRSVRFSD
jgi:hypothetical protein